MLGAIKRVISGDDMNLGSTTREGTTEDQQQGSNTNDNIQNQSDSSSSAISPELPNNNTGGPVLVESDNMDIDGAGGLTQMASAETPGSSLSDVSDADQHATGLDIDDDDDDYENGNNDTTMKVMDVEPAMKRSAGRGSLPRNDSKMSSDSSNSVRGGSQNSSRDWGWFEDVHASEHAHPPTMSKRKASTDSKGNKKGGGKSRLVPMLPNDAPHGLDTIGLIHAVNEAGEFFVFASGKETSAIRSFRKDPEKELFLSFQQFVFVCW